MCIKVTSNTVKTEQVCSHFSIHSVGGYLSTKEFFHKHPYDIFIPDGTTKIITGTLPPPRFSINTLKEMDVNFCYGSCDGMLWPVLDSIFNLALRFDNSLAAVEERKTFLRREHLGICDIVASCKRQKVDASDLGMYEIKLRDILFQLRKHPNLNTIIFTGGNSKMVLNFFSENSLKKTAYHSPPQIIRFLGDIPFSIAKER